MNLASPAPQQRSTFLLLFIAASLAALFSFLLLEFQDSTLLQLKYSQLWIVLASALFALFLTTQLFYITRSLFFKKIRSKPDIDQLVADNILFRHLSEKSGDMILICDGNCKILYANPITSKLIGHPLTTILHSDALKFILQDDHEQIKEDMARVKRGNSVPAREIRLLRHNGTILDVEVKGFSLQTGKNDSEYLGAILRDISNRKQNKKLLQVQEDWEQTFNTLPELVSVHDKNFIIIKANHALCQFLGKSPEDILGKPCYQIFHDSREPHPDCPHKRAIETATTVTEIIDDPTIGIPITVTCSPLFDAKDKRQGSVHIGRIIDEAATSTETFSEDVLPICASCKDIRQNDDNWISIEMFLVQHYGVQFTHGICKDCQKKLYPDFIRS